MAEKIYQVKDGTMTVAEAVAEFRSSMLLRYPFYGAIVLRVPFIEDRRVRTACTNGREVRYSPAFLATLTQAEINFVLLHEVYHILLQHYIPRGEKRPELWNIAQDIVVNSMLVNMRYTIERQAGLKMNVPQGAMGLSRFGMPAGDSRKSAEELYRMLLKDNPTKRRGIVVKLSAGRTVTVEAPPCDLPQEPPDQLLNAEIQKLIRLAVREHRENTPGSAASTLIPRTLMLEFTRKPLNWKRLLRDLLQDSGDDMDSSYATPERKYLHMDLLLPGHCRGEADELGEVWAFVDASGSIQNDTMERFLNELWHILRDFRCTMNIAYWDTSVTDVFRNIDSERKLRECLPSHSGGTDIDCVYRYIKENRLQPGLLIILTDGVFGKLSEGLMRPGLPASTIMVIAGHEDPDKFKRFGRVAAL